MATYIPNADDLTQPTEDKQVVSAALEFRTLKVKVESNQTRLDSLEANLSAVSVGGANTINVQRLSGDGVTTTFTVAFANSPSVGFQVYISGVYQQKNTYSFTTTQISFSSPPPAGTDNIEIVFIAITELQTVPVHAHDPATESTSGFVELATVTEVQAGTDTARAVTPAGLRNGFNASGSAPVYACRAWVNFDGTRNVDNTGASTDGQPVFIRASGNVTSVVKISTGNYMVNFTTAMPDANYCAVGSCSYDGNDAIAVQPNTYYVSNFHVGTVKANLGAYLDKSIVNVVIFR